MLYLFVFTSNKKPPILPLSVKGMIPSYLELFYCFLLKKSQTLTVGILEQELPFLLLFICWWCQEDPYV